VADDGSLLLQIIYDKVTNRSRGFAFVTMATAEEAAKAIQMFDGAVSPTPIGSILPQFVELVSSCSCPSMCMPVLT
jgi:RNA recognition motif-containing protein